MLLRPLACILLIAIAPGTASAQATPAPSASDTTAARIEVMKFQLSKMSDAQASHFSRHKKYASNMTPSRASTTAALVIRVTHASATGWSAVATSLADTSLHCGIYEGTAPSPNAAVKQPKTPGCW